MTETEAKIFLADKTRNLFRHDDGVRHLIEAIIMDAWTLGGQYEREACAKVADDHIQDSADDAEAIAAAIRARGESK